MTRFVAAWFVTTAIGAWAVNAWSHIDERPMPAAVAQRWALDALDAARAGTAMPAPPPEAAGYRASGPVITLAWRDGRVRARHVGTSDFVTSVQDAARRFSGTFATRPKASRGLRFTVAVPLGEGPIVRGVPYLSAFDLVPMREGVVAQIAGRREAITPDELWSAGSYDRAVVTPIPDLSFGTDLDAIAAHLARALGVEPARLTHEGTLRRFRAGTIARDVYPGRMSVRIATLERGAADGARFLVRHQEPDGRYTYLYDGRTDRALPSGGYNVPRHSGTTYFLAHAARTLDLPDAREAALQALAWVQANAMHTCGGPDKLCVNDGPRVASIGSTALTALAAAEVLAGGEAPGVRPMLEGLLRFVRSMQRADGELMHDYHLAERRPIDVQHMYYSGEAAYALLKAHAVLRNDADLAAAKQLMRHLTGAGWGFFGSRYFYGEEHWTCQAVAEAADRMDVEAGLDFCLRWLGYQERLQYHAGGTPWESDGAYGVTPLLVPRITVAASRGEAGAQIYRAAKARGRDGRALRAQIERGLRSLVRLQWAPGPAHLLFDPASARGGVPETQASPRVRSDFVQHAGSAMLLWLEILRGEAGATRAQAP